MMRCRVFASRNSSYVPLLGPDSGRGKSGISRPLTWKIYSQMAEVLNGVSEKEQAI